MRKMIANLIAAFIPVPSLRRRVRNAIKHKQIEQNSNLSDDFIWACGCLSMGKDGILQNYFLENNMPEKIAKLKDGLDEESKQNIDRYLQKMLFLPDLKISKNYRIKRIFLESLQTKREKELADLFFQNLPRYKKEIVLNRDEYNPDTFLFHHGLYFQNDRLKQYISDKDFIDGGAYIGDSAIMLNKYYNPRKVWSFEISKKNAALYKENLENNGITDDKYALVAMGLGDTRKSLFINDVGGQGANILSNGDDKVEIIDIDSFAQERELNVGFIKSDVEGVGLDALEGMKETIKKHRPVLCLAIYHNPNEFFDMYPRLREICGGGYKIMITQLHPLYDCNNEIVIFAYPKELDL
jgi:FkbM family methyltransferase